MASATASSAPDVSRHAGASTQPPPPTELPPAMMRPAYKPSPNTLPPPSYTEAASASAPPVYSEFNIASGNAFTSDFDLVVPAQPYDKYVTHYFLWPLKCIMFTSVLLLFGTACYAANQWRRLRMQSNSGAFQITMFIVIPLYILVHQLGQQVAYIRFDPPSEQNTNWVYTSRTQLLRSSVLSDVLYTIIFFSMWLAWFEDRITGAENLGIFFGSCPTSWLWTNPIDMEVSSVYAWDKLCVAYVIVWVTTLIMWIGHFISFVVSFTLGKMEKKRMTLEQARRWASRLRRQKLERRAARARNDANTYSPGS